MLTALYRWIDRNILGLGREMRLSYLPPLMVYCAAGVSGLTGIVGTFFIKDYLDLSAAFLAALGFWAMIPWALKMPIGHLVDLLWRYKAGLVYLGATLIACSLMIMIGLIGLGLASSAMNLFVRDVRYVVESINLLLFWMVPIVYTFDNVPVDFRDLYQYNPVAALILATQTIILGGAAPTMRLLIKLALVSAVSMGLGFAIFRRAEKRFYEYL